MNIKQITTFFVASILLVGCTAVNDNTSSSSTGGINQEQNITAAANPDPQAMQKIDQLFSLSSTQYEAKQKAIKECMASKGFIYTPNTSQAQRSLRSFIGPAELSLDQARSVGYQNQSSTVPELATGLEKPGAMEAFSGTPDSKTISVEGIPGGVKEDSCIASAYADLFGNVETGVFFEGGSMNLPLPYLNAAAVDTKMQELNKEWANCMENDHSLKFESPAIIAQYPDQQTIDTAVADAQCRQKTNYETELLSINNSYLTTFLNNNQDIIQQISDAKKVAETNAPAILNR